MHSLVQYISVFLHGYAPKDMHAKFQIGSCEKLLELRKITDQGGGLSCKKFENQTEAKL